NTNPSNLFHLAQSYFDAGDFEKAFEKYDIVTQLVDFDQTIYFSKFRMGVCAIKLQKSFELINQLLMDAHRFRPSRIEAIFELIKYCQETERYQYGYELGIRVISQKRSDDELNVDCKILDHHLYDKFSICAFYSGHYQDSINALETIL